MLVSNSLKLFLLLGLFNQTLSAIKLRGTSHKNQPINGQIAKVSIDVLSTQQVLSSTTLQSVTKSKPYQKRSPCGKYRHRHNRKHHHTATNSPFSESINDGPCDSDYETSVYSTTKNWTVWPKMNATTEKPINSTQNQKIPKSQTAQQVCTEHQKDSIKTFGYMCEKCINKAERCQNLRNVFNKPYHTNIQKCLQNYCISFEKRCELMYDTRREYPAIRFEPINIDLVWGDVVRCRQYYHFQFRWPSFPDIEDTIKRPNSSY